MKLTQRTSKIGSWYHRAHTKVTSTAISQAVLVLIRCCLVRLVLQSPMSGFQAKAGAIFHLVYGVNSVYFEASDGGCSDTCPVFRGGPLGAYQNDYVESILEYNTSTRCNYKTVFSQAAPNRLATLLITFHSFQERYVYRSYK